MTWSSSVASPWRCGRTRSSALRWPRRWAASTRATTRPPTRGTRAGCTESIPRRCSPGWRCRPRPAGVSRTNPPEERRSVRPAGAPAFLVALPDRDRAAGVPHHVAEATADLHRVALPRHDHPGLVDKRQAPAVVAGGVAERPFHGHLLSIRGGHAEPGPGIACQLAGHECLHADGVGYLRRRDGDRGRGVRHGGRGGWHGDRRGWRGARGLGGCRRPGTGSRRDGGDGEEGHGGETVD